MSSTDFTKHLSDYYKEEFEGYYGKYYPEILDYEMRKNVDTVNKRYKRRFGITMNELNKRLMREGINVSGSDRGYLYGSDIRETFEWYSAEYYDDKETIEKLLKNKEEEETWRKSNYIMNNTDLLIPNSVYDTSRHDDSIRISRSARAAIRKQLIEKKNLGLDEKKLLGYDWM